MIARALTILIFLQLSVVGLLCAVFYFLMGIHPALALVLAFGAVLLVRMGITLQNFLLSMLFRGRAPGRQRLGPLQTLRLYFREFVSTMYCSSCSMQRHAFSRRLAKRPSDPPALPVLLVHGYVCNSGYWKSMSGALAREGVNHWAVDLEPPLGSIEQYVPQLERALEAVCAESGSPKVVLVAHSMGGLVARAYLRRHGAARVAKLVTLGSPHFGTGLHFIAAGENVRQMAWHRAGGAGRCSDWLQALADSESAEVRALVVSIYSHHDNIVSPQTSSELPGARNVALQGIGHVALGLEPEVQRMVVREVKQAGV